MALGKVLVAELDLGSSTDTLGRWMAHHIAGLMKDAQAARDQERKRALEAEATDNIIKLWSQRGSFDNKLNPLFELKPVVHVLQTLDPDKNTWITHVGDQAANPIRSIYDTFRRLILSLLLRELAGAGRVSARVATAKSTAAFQEGAEKEIVAAVGRWLTEAQLRSLSKGRKKHSIEASETECFTKIARSIINEARVALEKLSGSLSSPHVNPVESESRARISTPSKRRRKNETALGRRPRR